MANPWEGWLEDQPQVGYGAWLGGLQGTPALKRYYEGMQGTMYNRYLGFLGGQVEGGGTPTGNWMDYLQNYPAQRQYQNLPGYMRGWNPQQNAPSYRWLNY